MITVRVDTPKNIRDKRGRIKPWPGMNEIIAENRKGFRVGARQKRLYTGIVKAAALEALQEQPWLVPDGKCDIFLEFHERDYARDPDNIYAGGKFIMDGLQEAGILVKDNQAHVRQIIYSLGRISKEPYVVATVVGSDV